jgi:hypothetical protein
MGFVSSVAALVSSDSRPTMCATFTGVALVFIEGLALFSGLRRRVILRSRLPIDKP